MTSSCITRCSRIVFPKSSIGDHVVQIPNYPEKHTLFQLLSCRQGFPVHTQRTSNGKLTQPLPLVGDHKAASPFQRCNLSLHRWPSSLLLQGSWVFFRVGTAKCQVYLQKEARLYDGGPMTEDIVFVFVFVFFIWQRSLRKDLDSTAWVLLLTRQLPAM